MKNHRFTLLLLLSLLLTNIVKAYNFKVDGLCYDRIDDSSVRVVHSGNEGWWANYEGLTDAIIPDSVTYEGNTYQVTEIAKHAFVRCVDLKNVVLPNSITGIEYQTFFYCQNLKSVSIGNGIRWINSKAFNSCPNLDSITLRRASPPYRVDADAFDQVTYENATIYVPTGRTAFFRDYFPWGKFTHFEEIDLPDIEAPESPFDDLYSKRLIIGYIDSESGGQYGNVNEEDGVQAIYFPTERMSHIKGNQITHIRFSMHSAYNASSSIKVWMGSDKDKRDLALISVPNPHEGWNEIELETPYMITGDSIFVGVQYHKTAAQIPCPVRWSSNAGSTYGYDECLLYSSGKWSIEKGTFHIQCLVQGDNIPEYDIHVEEIIEPTFDKVIKAGENYYATYNFRNWGSKAINRFELGAQVDGNNVEGSNYTTRVDRGVSRQQCWPSFNVGEGLSVGKHSFAIVPKVADGVEYTLLESPVEIPLKIYEHDMGRQKILVQVYTGAWCGYCPGFDKLIEEKMQERDDLVLVSIHARDNYVTDAGNIYLSMLYADGYPNVDLNRCIDQTLYNFREAVINKDLDRAKAQPSFASIKINGTYDEDTRKARITVSGERNEDFNLVEDWTNLTVLLVEDRVLGKQNGSNLGNAYPHDGVIRTNVTRIWGDKVVWDGDYYKMTYTADVSEAWNDNNIRVVAFLGKQFKGHNYSEIPVVNCDEVRLKDITSAVQDIRVDDKPQDIYDIYGRKVRSNTTSLQGLPHGIYIVGGKKVVK